MQFSFISKSANAKTGPIPQTYSDEATCPPSCAHYKTTCYAAYGNTAIHWRKLRWTWDEMLSAIALLPAGTLWRHNVAGDLPGAGEHVDAERLQQLVDANKGKRGFTYTHKHSDAALAAATNATQQGFTVNISCDSLSELDAMEARGAWPLVLTGPSDMPEKTQTPAGLSVVVCPAQSRDDVTCQSCQLCQRAERAVVVGFRAHGAKWKHVDLRLSKPTTGENT
jgi:hypothetical protein